MRFLDNLKISAKILSVIGLLSAVTALVVILGALSLHGVDKTYSQIVGKDDPAILALARAARSANIIGYAAYRAIAYPGASPEAQTSAKSVASNYANALKYIAEAEALKPERKDVLEGYRAQLKAIDECTAPVVELGLKDQSDNATKGMVKCDELIFAFTSAASKFGDAEIEKAQAATAAASASVTSTIITTSLVGIIGLALCGALGVWIAMAKITKPLVRLGDNMKLLAEGDLTTEIAGQDRGDEVGTMAKAVQVFKDNALALKEAEAKSAEQRRAADEQRRARALKLADLELSCLQRSPDLAQGFVGGVAQERRFHCFVQRFFALFGARGQAAPRLRQHILRRGSPRRHGLDLAIEKIGFDPAQFFGFLYRHGQAIAFGFGRAQGRLGAFDLRLERVGFDAGVPDPPGEACALAKRQIERRLQRMVFIVAMGDIFARRKQMVLEFGNPVVLCRSLGRELANPLVEHLRRRGLHRNQLPECGKIGWVETGLARLRSGPLKFGAF
jgi:HAMP domain-containing protein